MYLFDADFVSASTVVGLKV